MEKTVKCGKCGSVIKIAEDKLQSINGEEFVLPEESPCSCCGWRLVKIINPNPVIYQVTCECGTFICKGDIRTAHCPMCNTLGQKFGSRVRIDWEMNIEEFEKKQLQCTNCYKFIPVAAMEVGTYCCPFCSSKHVKLTGEEKKEDPIDIDSLESIRKEVEDFISEARINVPELKGKIIAIGSQIMATVAAIPDKDIENLQDKTMETVREYSEIAIAWIPTINAISDILKNIKK